MGIEIHHILLLYYFLAFLFFKIKTYYYYHYFKKKVYEINCSITGVFHIKWNKSLSEIEFYLKFTLKKIKSKKSRLLKKYRQFSKIGFGLVIQPIQPKIFRFLLTSNFYILIKLNINPISDCPIQVLNH